MQMPRLLQTRRVPDLRFLEAGSLMWTHHKSSAQQKSKPGCPTLRFLQGGVRKVGTSQK